MSGPRLGFAAVDPWISTLDELLRRPLGPDSVGGLRPHHIDLRVSQDFWDDDTREDVFGPTLAEFEADRARLAQAITSRYGPPMRKSLHPYFDDDVPPEEPGRSLFAYLAGWFFEVDVWRAGDRGIVAEIGHQDKELPLQLMLVVGDLSRTRPAKR